MNFPNKTYGNLGVVVGVENAKRFKPPVELMALIHEGNLGAVPVRKMHLLKMIFSQRVGCRMMAFML